MFVHRETDMPPAHGSGLPMPMAATSVPLPQSTCPSNAETNAGCLQPELTILMPCLNEAETLETCSGVLPQAPGAAVPVRG